MDWWMKAYDAIYMTLAYQTLTQVPQQNQVCILNSKHNIIHTFGTRITIDKDGFIYVCSFNNFQIYN